MKKRYFTLFVLISLLLFMNSPSRSCTSLDANPLNDGYSDGQEISAKTNPLDANSHPIDTRDPITVPPGMDTPFRNWPAIYAGVQDIFRFLNQ